MKILEALTRKSANALLCSACIISLIAIGTITACGSTPEAAPEATPEATGCILQSSCSLDKQEYTQGAIVNISVTNDLDYDVQLNNPFYVVYRLEQGGNGSEWVEVGRVDCPCGAMCKMAASITIEPGEAVEYEWDQIEQWCSDISGSTETFSEQVQPGRYKIMLPFDVCDCYLEFTIE
ncbi:MAG: hypothetical protein WC455_03525 [Dehalococcoidia bacterium]|jgi:hypothetical protein